MISFKFVGFTLVVYVSHKVNVLVTDIILNITSPEHLMFTSLHIGSRLFELFSKEVHVKKTTRNALNDRNYILMADDELFHTVNVKWK